MEDEEFWNSSNTTGFSFDDEEVIIEVFRLISKKNQPNRLPSTNDFEFFTRALAPVASLFDAPKSIHGRTKQGRTSVNSGSEFGWDFVEQQSATKPIEFLVTKRSLAIVLGNESGKKVSHELSVQKQVDSQWEPPPVTSTVRSIVLSRPFSLHLYRSLDSKTKLLHEAVKSGDGNTILAVVLFLQKTLKRKLFCNLLQAHPPAVPVYLNYLSTRYEANTLVELLQMLGQPRDAAIKDFQFAIQPNQNIDKRLMKLKGLQRDHFSTRDADDKLFFDNFFKYVEWQVISAERQGPLLGTVTASLTHLCSQHWDQLKGHPLSPLTLISLLGISERSYHWTAITTRAAVAKWDDISSLVLTKGWLGGKKLKTVVSAERIVIELHRRQAPEQIVYEFFGLIESHEKQLELARKLSWHRAAIDTLVAMRDRQGLVQYQASMNPQASDYIYGESALRANTKWKN